MSGDVHPKIRKQSQAEANAEYDRALGWLQNIVGSVGRFRNYQTTFSTITDLLLEEDRMDAIQEVMSPPGFVETRFEGYGLVNIWRQFQSDTSPLLADKLKFAVSGADLTSSEGENTGPRDILFELETAALLKTWGLAVNLGSGSDLSFAFKGVPVLCECKRVQKPKTFDKRLQKAASQLRDALKDPGRTQNTLGMITIDVSRIVHLDAAGLDRYPPTQYGEYLLPSNMVAVLNNDQFQKTVRERFASFTDQHQRSFKRKFLPRIAGFMLCYNVPAVEMQGNGRVRVNSYQQIGLFDSATPAEREYFGSFHSDILQHYRRPEGT
jgi:hypothetical protein